MSGFQHLRKKSLAKNSSTFVTEQFYVRVDMRIFRSVFIVKIGHKYIQIFKFFCAELTSHLCKKLLFAGGCHNYAISKTIY